jgi:hypothetical protein
MGCINITITIDHNRIICNIIVKIYPFCFRLTKDFWKKNRQFNFIIFFWFWDLTFHPDFRKNVTISHSYEQHFPMLPIILFPTIYNLAVCSLSTLNPSEQFSIYSTIKDTKDTAKYASYLDLHLDTDSKGPLRAKFYYTINDFHVSIVSLLHLYLYICVCVNIPVAHTYGVIISQLIAYSWTCDSCYDLWDKYTSLRRKRKLVSRNYDNVSWWLIFPQTVASKSKHNNN